MLEDGKDMQGGRKSSIKVRMIFLLCSKAAKFCEMYKADLRTDNGCSEWLEAPVGNRRLGERHYGNAIAAGVVFNF